MTASHLCLVLLLSTAMMAGCVTPSREYFGHDPVSVELNGRQYRVWSRRDGVQGQVQVVRMGYVRRSEHAGLIEAMIAAAEQATGCRVLVPTVEGDTGVINARIRCQV